MKPNLVIFGACEMSWQLCQKSSSFNCHIVTNSSQAQKPVGGFSSLHDASRGKNFDLHVTEAIELWNLPGVLINGEPVILLSIGAPWFFKNAFLKDTLKHPIYNLHGTRLPKDRGGNLFSWLILTGQRTGICLLHELTEEIDAGAIMDYEEFIYPTICHKPIDYINVYEAKNVAFVLRFLEKWQNGNIENPITSQPDYLSSYWPRLESEVNGWIDWRWSSQNIERFICAFDAPYGGARCRWRNKKVIVRDAYSQSTDGQTHPFQHGIVYRNNGKWLSVAANGGEVIICSIADENGISLLNEVKPGDRLYSLSYDLEKASTRVVRAKTGLKIQPNFP